jgi:hypothetical protein
MINSDYFELFQDDSIDKQLKITCEDGTVIENPDLFSESMELSRNLCSETSLTFGTCEADSFKIKIANIVSPLINQWLTVTYTLDGRSDVFYVGKFKVYSDMPTADRKWREITAYDIMYDIINAEMSDWYNELIPEPTTEITLKQFRDSFFKHFGIEQESINLVNDSMTVRQTIQPSELSGKDVINKICEINGCFGHITNEGKFRYIYLTQYIEGVFPAEDIYPANDLFPADSRTTSLTTSGKYISATYEDYVCQSITKLQIRQEENDIGSVVGDGDNAYIIQDNFLVYGMGADELKEVATNVLSKITECTYRPFTAETKGNPCFEVGDAVRLVTKYELIESYILQSTLKGVQALRNTFTTTGEETYTEKVNSVNTSIVQLKGKTNELTRTVEETNSTIKETKTSLETSISTVQSNLDTESATLQGNIDTVQSNLDEVEGNLSDDIDGVQRNLNLAKTTLTNEIKQTASSTTATILATTDTWYLKDYSVKYQGIGTNTELYSASEPNVGDLYLDTDSGILYKLATVASSGTANYYNVTYTQVEQLTKTSKKLQSQIEQTETSITTSVSNNYYTKAYMDDEYKNNTVQAAANTAKTDANSYTDEQLKSYSTTTEVESKIEQKADSITSSVLSTTDTWNTSGYTIAFQGIGTSGTIYTTSTPTVGAYYLDYATGTVYKFTSVAKAGDNTYNVTYSKVAELEKTSRTLESKIKQNADEIELKVSADGVISAINLISQTDSDGSAIKISADKINLTGYITAEDLSGSGKSIINGDNITSGTITGVTLTSKDSDGIYITITDGEIVGGDSDGERGNIYFSTIYDNDKKKDYNALYINSTRIALSADRFCISESEGSDSFTNCSSTYDMKYVVSITDNKDGTISWKTATVKFRGGLCITSP